MNNFHRHRLPRTGPLLPADSLSSRVVLTNIASQPPKPTTHFTSTHPMSTVHRKTLQPWGCRHGVIRKCRGHADCGFGTLAKPNHPGSKVLLSIVYLLLRRETHVYLASSSIPIQRWTCRWQDLNKRRSSWFGKRPSRPILCILNTGGDAGNN
jgi:hypothetical protein